MALLDKGLFYLPVLLLMEHFFGLYGIAFARRGNTGILPHSRYFFQPPLEPEYAAGSLLFPG